MSVYDHFRALEMTIAFTGEREVTVHAILADGTTIDLTGPQAKEFHQRFYESQTALHRAEQAHDVEMKQLADWYRRHGSRYKDIPPTEAQIQAGARAESPTDGH